MGRTRIALQVRLGGSRRYVCSCLMLSRSLGPLVVGVDDILHYRCFGMTWKKCLSGSNPDKANQKM